MPPNSGFGRDPFWFEGDMENSEPVNGRAVDHKYPLGLWRLTAGAVIPAAGAGAVGFGAIATDLEGLIWDAAADQTDVISICDHLEGEARPLDKPRGQGPLKLMVLARKLDTTGGASENADLALTADLRWLYSDPDDTSDPSDAAASKLTTLATALLDAKAVAAAEEKFRWYTLDLGARLLAEGKEIKPYSAFQIRLSVNEAVGTALAVEVLATRLVYRRHAVLLNRLHRQV